MSLSHEPEKKNETGFVGIKYTNVVLNEISRTYDSYFQTQIPQVVAMHSPLRTLNHESKHRHC